MLVCFKSKQRRLEEQLGGEFESRRQQLISTLAKLGLAAAREELETNPSKPRTPRVRIGFFGIPDEEDGTCRIAYLASADEQSNPFGMKIESFRLQEGFWLMEDRGTQNSVSVLVDSTTPDARHLYDGKRMRLSGVELVDKGQNERY